MIYVVPENPVVPVGPVPVFPNTRVYTLEPVSGSGI
jgi:hypothetical protein